MPGSLGSYKKFRVKNMEHTGMKNGHHLPGEKTTRQEVGHKTYLK
jgi:hypothetical protein